MYADMCKEDWSASALRSALQSLQKCSRTQLPLCCLLAAPLPASLSLQVCLHKDVLKPCSAEDTTQAMTAACAESVYCAYSRV